jgi:hypothetical protein
MGKIPHPTIGNRKETHTHPNVKWDEVFNNLGERKKTGCRQSQTISE